VSYLSATYVERFRCVGTACIATCCRGWSIQLTTEDRTTVEQALATAALPLRPLTDEIVPDLERGPNSHHPYVMRCDKSGACVFLSTDQLCQLHAGVGPTALPSVCAQYPREVTHVDRQREIWAAMSCPEAARLCLLDPHGADLVQIPDVSGLRYVNDQLRIDDKTPDYSAYIDEIRRFMCELFSLRSYALRARLFFVAYFAHRVSPYFHEQASQVDRQRLLADMNALRQTALLDALAAEFEAINVPGTYAISLVASVVKARSGLPEYPAPKLATDLEAPAAGMSVSPEESLATEEWLESWLDYSIRRTRWELDFAGLLDQAFENYCKIFWMKDLYVHSPNLLAHATSCMLRIAILRYRLFYHPALENPVPESTAAERRTLLERALLTVVTEVARAIEHDRPFQNSLDAALARRGMQDLAHASLLLML
jgi:lysine-N-methylase